MRREQPGHVVARSADRRRPIADANTFTGSAIDIFGEGCGSVVSINANKLTSGYRGIVLVTQAAQYFEILSNTFDGLTSPFMGMGINTNASATISKLNDNTFTNISESAGADTAAGATTGYAIALGGGNVLQAQRNVIANNDNGVYIGGSLNTNFDFSSDGTSTNRNQNLLQLEDAERQRVRSHPRDLGWSRGELRRQPMGPLGSLDERVAHDERERHRHRHGDERWSDDDQPARGDQHRVRDRARALSQREQKRDFK